ncbi:MAG TPA: hypothetical protein VL096_06955, partial [Pirellulaceae bacterium]|nr:hypothetical protein [Pirellulaceae bacterium]
SCLADAGRGKANMLAVVVKLMTHMAQFAFTQGVDELLIAVHPHHVGFYERFTGFEVIGEKKSYSAVRNHPAVALALDLKNGERNHPRAHHRFFGQPLDAHQLRSPGLSHEILSELRWIVDLTQSTHAHPRKQLTGEPVAA